MKKVTGLLLAAALMLTSCAQQQSPYQEEPLSGMDQSASNNGQASARFAFTVEPETFAVTITTVAGEHTVSRPGPGREVSGYQESEGMIRWEYPQDKVSITLGQAGEYLDVTISYTGDGEADFQWPLVQGDNYTLPLGEGKQFSVDDPVWRNYLGGSELDTLEGLSMAFFAAGADDRALLYILTDNYDNELLFGEEGGSLQFTLSHTFPSVNPHKSYSLRIYPVENDPVPIAKIYKAYVEENRGIKTLREKEAENPEVAKLYGAAHIYLFDMMLLSEEDVDWAAFRQNLDAPVFTHIRGMAADLEDNAEFLAVLNELATQDYVGQYQRTVLVRGISELLRLESFCDPAVFPDLESLPSTTRAQVLERNKQALFRALPGVFAPVDSWADDRTVNVVKSMSDAGIEHAWIGLDNWEQALGKPVLVQQIADQGWLVGPYDSYHSIHPPGEEQWNTAAFPDASLYEKATVINTRGDYIAGFQGVGRKLNPTLAFPQVQSRVEGILENGIAFNSWFVDCDATGEVYNDYAPDHPTTREQDVAARLERMEWLSSEKGMVVGSEGGNDFAANAIAFAHGLELPSFSWMDEDMKSNKDSEYYLGRYYAPEGGAPEKMTKQVPVKEQYKSIFLNPAYNVPLYKLVYNDAVITGYHWDWPTLKIADEVQNRQLYELLYNVPPMYHLDKFQWEEHGADIAAHVREWSAWSKQVIHEEMTDFHVLSEDSLVQMAVYGDRTIIVNWSDSDYVHGETVVEAKGYQIL